MSEQRERLAALVRELAVVHGRVTLSSGKEADYYVDLRRITLDGEASPLVGRVMRDLTADLDYDDCLGVTYDDVHADPDAAWLAVAVLRAGRIRTPELDVYRCRCGLWHITSRGQGHIVSRGQD